jgi:hypothetical protein
LRCAAPPFAMIRLREVRQLEIDGESFCHPMRLSNVEAVDYSVRAIHQLVFIADRLLRSFVPRVLLTAFD